MRHRAQTPLVRLVGVARTRRAAAAGTVALLGAAAGGYLTVADSFDLGGGDRLAAGPPAGALGARAHPDAAALEDMRTARTPSTSRGADRGQARTSPSASVLQGTAPAQQPTASAASQAPGAPEPGAVAGTESGTARSSAPRAGGETPATPSGGSTGSPSSPRRPRTPGRRTRRPRPPPRPVPRPRR